MNVIERLLNVFLQTEKLTRKNFMILMLNHIVSLGINAVQGNNDRILVAIRLCLKTFLEGSRRKSF